ncbi:GerAB/ArcD/ProY family transporter [Marinicrinis sediminis]|uniref:Endospore germination permease n=1 Tax=Marinicrinis sediminis TaxID=1652465 RepID=A0ABW5REK2_9BACL
MTMTQVSDESLFNKDRIGYREFAAMILFAIGMKATDTTPSLMYSGAENASWMVPLLSFAVLGIPVFLMMKVYHRFPNQHMFEIATHLLGKPISTLLFFCFLVITFVAIVTDTRSYVDVIGTMYFEKSPMLVIYILLMLALVYGAKKGLEAIATVAWLTLFYIIITFVGALLLMIPYLQMGRIFPLFGPGYVTILKESMYHISIYGDILVLMFLLPLLKNKREFSRGLYVGFITSGIQIVVFTLFFILLYDYPSIEKISYPFHESIRFIQIGSFFTNIETLFLPFWLIGTIVRFTIYLYMLGILFGKVFQIQEHEHLFFPLGILIIWIGMIPENSGVNVYLVREQLLRYASPFFLLVPMLIWITAAWKGRSAS